VAAQLFQMAQVKGVTLNDDDMMDDDDDDDDSIDTDDMVSSDTDFSLVIPHSRTRTIQSRTEDEYQSPVNIIWSLNFFVERAQTFLLQSQNGFDDLVSTHKSVLDGLAHLPTPPGQEGLLLLPEKNREKPAKTLVTKIVEFFGGKSDENSLLEKHNRKVVKALIDKITELLGREAFSLAKGMDLAQTIKGMEHSLSIAQVRVTSELDKNTRVRMSTIGSSHYIQGTVKKPKQCWYLMNRVVSLPLNFLG
jgi:hypothetical protein